MVKLAGKVTGVMMCVGLFLSGSLCFGQAYEQLEGASNTGVTFDGSDGNRFGMDTGIGGAGDVPEPSAPEPVYAEPVYEQEPVYQYPGPVYQEPQQPQQDTEPVYQESEPLKEGGYDAD